LELRGIEDVLVLQLLGIDDADRNRNPLNILATLLGGNDDLLDLRLVSTWLSR
jgi:hypothetical protein